ncbi:MAG: helix-turn-helix domain-containing protein [Spirochaetales bacterium]|nr:helix-turn-helix domain-containing protein [Spirochaetales bacterium]
MESFGEKLKSTRENLNYSIEQIARDTNIAKRYLIGLEEEDFSVFPGETYLRGFLRNYAEYLGLDAEELISIYHNMKIQEQPIPMEQLIEQKRVSPRPFLIGGGVLAAVAAIVLVLMLTNPFQGVLEVTQKPEDEIQKEVLFTGQQIDLVVFKGFVIKVPSGSTQVEIITQKIDSGITITIGNETVDIYIGQQKELDINKDEIPDLLVALIDIFTEQNQKKASISLKPAVSAGVVAVGDSGEYTITQVEKDLIADGTAKVIAENTAPSSFTIELSALQNFYFIYIPDKKERQEKYFTQGETLSLPVERVADIRFSDAGAVQATVNGNPVEIGSTGKIRAKIIKWVKDKEIFQLVAFPNK